MQQQELVNDVLRLDVHKNKTWEKRGKARTPMSLMAQSEGKLMGVLTFTREN